MDGSTPPDSPSGLLPRRPSSTTISPRCLPRYLLLLAAAVLLILVSYHLILYAPDLNHLTIHQHHHPRPDHRHPVEILHHRARHNFIALQARQSQTPDEAAHEYTRRYGRAPPPRFRNWVAYALNRTAPIIDDYDTIHDSLAPFYRMAPADVTRHMEEALDLGPGNVLPCDFATGEGFDEETCGYYGETANRLLGNEAKAVLPNFTVLANYLDEPTLLVTQPHDASLNLAWEDLSQTSITRPVASSCKQRGPRKPAANHHPHIETHGLPFVQDVATQKDLCRHPEFAAQHGFLDSPTSLQHFSAAMPILSRAAPHPFADTLIPSPVYSADGNMHDAALDTLPWRQKENRVFWAGSTTGGQWHKYNWKRGHRQRLVSLASNLPLRKPVTYLARWPAAGPEGKRGYSAWRAQGVDPALYNVHFTRALQCADDVAAAQAEYFDIEGVLDAQPGLTEPGEPYRYRFLLDVDGNSYSGRFHKALATNATPLKMSIFREWHDERLVPWLHYIPVSQSLEELPELMRFLAMTEEGRAIAETVAQAGQRWYRRALTPEQQGVYWYRLLLELAWLQDPERRVEEGDGA